MKALFTIPLAFCLSALVGAALYAFIGFAATHAFPYADIAGKNLGSIAEMMMPPALSKFFIIGGALFALNWWLSGIPFDLLHCAGNFALALVLFVPLRKLLERLQKR